MVALLSGYLSRGPSYRTSGAQGERPPQLRHVRYYQPQVQAAHLTVGAIEKSTAEAGLEPFLGDLRQALWVALTEPDARKRWLKGEPVFETAKPKSPIR